MKKIALLLGVLLLLSAPVPAQAQQWDESGSIISNYEEAAGEWARNLLGPSRELFVILAGLDLAIFCLFAIFTSTDTRVTTGRLVIKVLVMLILLAILVNTSFWIAPIIQGFMDAGQIATGMPALEPGEITYRGYQLHREIATSYDMSFFSMDFGSITAFFASYVVLIAFTFIALLVTVALVESIIILSTAALWFSAAPFRLTVGITEGYIRYLVEVGIRLFLLQLLVGFGTSLSFRWMEIIQNAPDFDVGPLISVGIGATIFSALAFIIPQKMATVVSSGLDINLRGVITQ